jgi:uncharacterized protein YjlB
MSNEPTTLYFKGDGNTPNNRLPVILYKSIFQDLKPPFSVDILHLFQSNGWTNNWGDIIKTQNHYHSNTHEVLGINSGKVEMVIGGARGKIIRLKEGDVIILPAGIGYYSLENKKKYIAVGGYPNGEDWDMIYDEHEKYINSQKSIAKNPFPILHPIHCLNGPLQRKWSVF